MAKYLSRLFQRAVQNTRNDVGFVSPKATIFHIVFAAILLLVVYFGVGLGPALQQINEYWFVVLAFFAWAIFVFFVNLILSPWQLQMESDTRIICLENELDDRARQQEVLNRLWELRSDGIALRNEPVKTAAEFLRWQNRYEVWREDILEAAGGRSANLQQWLSRLERMGPPPGGLKFYTDPHTKNSEHFRLASIMTEILVRLQKHLQRDLT